MEQPPIAPSRYTVTAALPYANGPLHIGHLAGAYLPADIYVRYLRACGKDVLFICGSDEHGAGITIQARKEGISPQALVDKYHVQLKQTFADFGIGFDIYSRTSLPIHHETAAEFFLHFHHNDKLIQKTSEQFYDEEAGMFLPDRYVMGTCPKCSNPRAYGDQCEKCGSTLSPNDLIEPKSTISGTPPVMRQTSHWFLPLDRFQAKLERYILTEHAQDWKTNVLGQCRSWLQEGLMPRAITRDMEWGVKVPLPDAEGKVLYVWFDAPLGYISATKDWANQQPGRDWKPYWQSPESRLVHFIGKDNIVFHCIIFPAILMEHGGYIWADSVPANEFLNLEGEKISTSRNWAIWVHEYIQDFPGKNDVLRYALCAAMPETKDNDFTWKEFQARNNNELIAVPGNLINRVITLIHKYYDGNVPTPNELTESDTALLRNIARAAQVIGKKIETFHFREALFEFMELARAGNKYLTEHEPWKAIKTDPERVKTVLYVSLQVVAALGIVACPFLPDTANKIQEMLTVDLTQWQTLQQNEIVPANTLIHKPILLFEKIEDNVIEAQVEKLRSKGTIPAKPASVEPPKASAFKQDIGYPDFEKLDFRVATIVAAKPVKNADKLLELTLDTMHDTRTVVSGIASYYKPEDIIGQQVVLLANLQPKKLKGILSQGMILMAEDRDGRLVFVKPESIIPPGSVIK